MKTNKGLILGILLCVSLLLIDRFTKHWLGLHQDLEVSWNGLGYSFAVNSALSWGLRFGVLSDYLTTMLVQTVTWCLWIALLTSLTIKSPLPIIYFWMGSISNLIDWFIWGGTSDPIFILVYPRVIHFNVADLCIYGTALYMLIVTLKAIWGLYKRPGYALAKQ